MRRRRLPLGIVFFTILLDLLGFGMILPLLPFYALNYGASPLEIGLLSSVYSLAQFICAPLWGALSDRRGRRGVLLLSIFGTAAAHLWLAVAPTLLVLFLARLAAGAFAANYATAQAYVADVTEGDERAKGMGMVGAAFGLGFVLGPAMGAVLASTAGYVAVPLAAAALSAVNFILALVLLPESLPPAARHAGKARWLDLGALHSERKGPSASWLLLLIFLVILGFSAMESMLALFCEQRFGFGVAETGWLLVYIGVVMVIIQGGLIGTLNRRFGERRLILGGIFLMGAGLFLLPFAGTLAGLLAVAGLLALGSGLYSPTVPTLVSRLTPATRQGASLGLTRSPSSLARAIGPFWGGWLFESFGPQWPFWGGSVVMAGALLVGFWILGGKGRQEL